MKLSSINFTILVIKSYSPVEAGSFKASVNFTILVIKSNIADYLLVKRDVLISLY